MTIPDIKITYFEVAGRAEMSRLALAIGNIPFTDERIAGKDWPELKPGTPYGAMPLVTLDGKNVYAQSNAIVRYCGKLAGLYPEDAAQALFVDEILDLFDDVAACLFRYRGGDKEGLRAARAKVVEEDFPRYIGGLEKRLEASGDCTWAVGEEMTIADLGIYSSFAYIGGGMLDFIDFSAFEMYPKLMRIYHAVKEHPKVVAWYKDHPAP